MTFRERLKEEISYNGFVMKELADRAGLKPRSLEAYCRTSETRMPAADVAVRLAKVLNVTVEYLVTGEDKTTTKEDAKYIKFRKLNDMLLYLTDDDLADITDLVVGKYKRAVEKELEKKTVV